MHGFLTTLVMSDASFNWRTNKSVFKLITVTAMPYIFFSSYEINDCDQFLFVVLQILSRASAMGRLGRFLMVDVLSYFAFQPVLHDSYNKDRGMCYTVCMKVHIKDPLLAATGLLPCYLSGPLPLCSTLYNHK